MNRLHLLASSFTLLPFNVYILAFTPLKANLDPRQLIPVILAGTGPQKTDFFCIILESTLRYDLTFLNEIYSFFLKSHTSFITLPALFKLLVGEFIAFSIVAYGTGQNAIFYGIAFSIIFPIYL